LFQEKPHSPPGNRVLAKAERTREPAILLQEGMIGTVATWPWLVAFTFGPLHGPGFAGALADVGLPRHEIPLALLMFNVGVELGQVVFAAVVFASVFALRKVRIRWPAGSRQLPAYGIGAMAFWFIQRISGLL